MAVATELASAEGIRQPGESLPFELLLGLMKRSLLSYMLDTFAVMRASRDGVTGGPEKIRADQDDLRQYALIAQHFLSMVGGEHVQANPQIQTAYNYCAWSLDHTCSGQPVAVTARFLEEVCSWHKFDESSRQALLLGLSPRLVAATRAHAAASTEAVCSRSEWSSRAGGASAQLVRAFGMPLEDAGIVAAFIAMCSTEAVHDPTQPPVYFVR